MNATVLDLRKNMRGVMAALERNEQVTLTYRGRKKAVIIPCEEAAQTKSAAQHPAFGISKDHQDIDGVDGFVRQLRQRRKF